MLISTDPVLTLALVGAPSRQSMASRACAPLLVVLGLFAAPAATTAGTVSVPPGGDLQAALNAAQPGDTIVLQAGASYIGSFTLPTKSGAGEIVIRTSIPDTALPPGVRVIPADTPKLARIVTPGRGLAAIYTDPGAHDYRLIGLEITAAEPSSVVYEMVALGTAGPEQSTLDSVPHHITIDRCFVHGWPNANFKRGIGLNSAHTDILNSHISDFHSDVQDSQAIGGFNGPGPFRIINNRVEAAAENIMFGGATPSIYGLVPSRIEIRRNHLYKPMSWKPGEPGSTSYRPWIKNLFEVKNGQDILLDGNIMENNWSQSDQHGTAIVLSPRSEEGSAPWALVQRITFTNNKIINVGGGVGILNRDDGVPNNVETNAITFRNNVFQGIRNDYSYDSSRVIQVTGTSQVTFDHNTILHANNFVRAYGAATTGFAFTNNIVSYGWGLWTDCGMDQAGLNCHFPGSAFGRNAVIGATGETFSAFNFYPATEGAVGFVDAAAGNYRLAASSPLKNAGSDGKDVGADLDAIELAYAGSEPPVSNRAPIVAITSPGAGAIFVAPALVPISATASDPDGTVARVEFFEGSTSLGRGVSDGNGTYSLTWNPVAPGNYVLTARATDTQGATSVSASVGIVVNAPANVGPSVTLTSPLTGTSYTAPAQITIEASAADPDGTVTSVAFFQGSTKIGEDATAPFTFNWIGVPAGSYTLSARATDNAGLTTISSAVNVTVVEQPAAEFALAVSPSSRFAKRNGATTYTVTVSRTSGFSDPVTLSIGNVLPVGATVTFGPESSTGSCRMTVTTSKTPVGSYVLLIVGTSGSMQRTTSVTLNVRR